MGHKSPLIGITSSDEVELVKVRGENNQVLKVNSNLGKAIKEDLMHFLKTNMDIFARNLEDIPGISQKKLSIDLHKKLAQQREKIIRE